MYVWQSKIYIIDRQWIGVLSNDFGQTIPFVLFAFAFEHLIWIGCVSGVCYVWDIKNMQVKKFDTDFHYGSFCVHGTKLYYAQDNRVKIYH